MAQAPAPDHRRKWDKEEFERIAKERANPDDAVPDKPAKPEKRELLQPRDYKIDLESRVGKSTVITKGVTNFQEGGGYFCNVCDCIVKDSINFLDHVNGKKHQRNLGMSMKVKKATVEEVRARIAAKMQKTEDKKKEYDMEERMKEIKEEVLNSTTDDDDDVISSDEEFNDIINDVVYRIVNRVSTSLPSPHSIFSAITTTTTRPLSSLPPTAFVSPLKLKINLHAVQSSTKLKKIKSEYHRLSSTSDFVEPTVSTCHTGEVQPVPKRSRQPVGMPESSSSDSNNGGSSDYSEDDDDGGEVSATQKKSRKSKKNRRNIRKLFREDQLTDSTLRARQEEEMRLQRLQMVSGDVDTPVKSKDIITLSSDEEDPTPKKPTTSTTRGLHSNDAFNVTGPDGRMLVNKNHPAADVDVCIAEHLVPWVKPHQLGGIRFMYDNVVESFDQFKNRPGLGCILAHSMGLGKTLQVVAFVDCLFRHLAGLCRRILILCPVNTLQNWVYEFEQWTPKNPENPDLVTPRCFEVFLLNEQQKTSNSRADLIEKWYDRGGALVMGYEMFRLLTAEKFLSNCNNSKSSGKGRKRTKDVRIGPDGNPQEVIDIEEEELAATRAEKVRAALLDPGPNVVICDEGHRIKNFKANISKSLEQINTKRRVVLTGYPLQNNLIEYWCMVQFVRPSILGTRQEFSNLFEKPILNGQCADSTKIDVRLARMRTHVLTGLLRGFVQRRSHDLLKKTLPLKQEFVLFVRKSKAQELLYARFMRYLQFDLDLENAINPLRAFAICCKIWNHPDVLYKLVYQSTSSSPSPATTTGLLATQSSCSSSVGSTVTTSSSSFDNNGGFCSASSIQDLDDLDLPAESDSNSGIGKPPAKRGRKPKNSIDLMKSRSTSNVGAYNPEEFGMNPFESRMQGISYYWSKEIFESLQYLPNYLENGSKFYLTMKILDESLHRGEKVLIFSQSLFTLTLLADFLQSKNVPLPPGEIQTEEKWKLNRNFLRLDGHTNSSDRERLISRFNNEQQIKLFLLSTRAGSLGINLTSASRVIVMDVSWNPCHDAQAVCRVYRYGQQRQCFIYRLVCENSMERAIYNRQVGKQGISDTVVDDRFVKTALEQEEMNNLMRYDESGFGQSWQLRDDECVNDVLLRDLCIKDGNSLLTRSPMLFESLLLDGGEHNLSEIDKAEAENSFKNALRVFRGFDSPSLAATAGAGGGAIVMRGGPAKSIPWYSDPYGVHTVPDFSRTHRRGRPTLDAMSSIPRFSGGLVAPLLNSDHRSHIPPSHVAVVRPVQSTPLPMSVRSTAGSDQFSRNAPQNQGQILSVDPFLASHSFSLPSVSKHGNIYNVEPQQKGAIVRTLRGVYLRMDDSGEILDARGSFLDRPQFQPYSSHNPVPTQQVEQPITTPQPFPADHTLLLPPTSSLVDVSGSNGQIQTTTSNDHLRPEIISLEDD